jgi:hypothetical protein
MMSPELVKNANASRGQRPGRTADNTILETSVEARQAFLDRPVVVVLCASLAIAIGMGIVLWMLYP